MSDHFPQPLQSNDVPAILFRVEAWQHHGASINYNTFRRNNLIARDLGTNATLSVFRNHLTWEHEPNPFISFFSSWQRALKWRDWLIRRRNAQEIIITATWATGLDSVYDAYEIARRLKPGLPNLGTHLHEYLLYGSVLAQENRILSIFPATMPAQSAAVSVPKLRSKIQMPGNILVAVNNRILDGSRQLDDITA